MSRRHDFLGRPHAHYIDTEFDTYFPSMSPQKIETPQKHQPNLNKVSVSRSHPSISTFCADMALLKSFPSRLGRFLYSPPRVLERELYLFLILSFDDTLSGSSTQLEQMYSHVSGQNVQGTGDMSAVSTISEEFIMEWNMSPRL
jgi:hypothetical protein